MVGRISRQRVEAPVPGARPSFAASASNGANVPENDLCGQQPCAVTKCPLASYMQQQETSACNLVVKKAPAESARVHAVYFRCARIWGALYSPAPLDRGPCGLTDLAGLCGKEAK